VPAQLDNHSQSQEIKRYEGGEVIMSSGSPIMHEVKWYHNSSVRCAVTGDTAMDCCFYTLLFRAHRRSAPEPSPVRCPVRPGTGN